MNGPSISVAMIVKDEEENLEQCLSSFRQHVDEVIVVDTGSTDGTKEVAKKFDCKVYDYNHITNPESFFIDDEATCKAFGAPPPYSGLITLGDFGAARNRSFDLATKDYVFWVDADDVIVNAGMIRTCVNDLAVRGLDMGFLKYDYAVDAQGRVHYSQWRERIIKRGGARWHNCVHEVLMPTKPTMSNAKYPEFYMTHRRKADRKSTPNRNYKLLLRHLHQLEQIPNSAIDPRTLFYLGQEARFIEPHKAILFYEKYLKTSGWPEERAAAHIAMGSLLEFGVVQGLSKEDAYAQADREYACATAEEPASPDGLFGLARIAYLRGRWQDCVNYSERGFKIGNNDSMLGMNPMDRLYRPHVYYNHALANLGRIEEAIRSCEEGLKVCPDDPGVAGGAPGMLVHNLNTYKKMLADRSKNPVQNFDPQVSIVFDKNEDVASPPPNTPRDVLVIYALQLWKQNMAAHDSKRAYDLLDALPTSVTTDPVISKMRAHTEKIFPRGKVSPIEVVRKRKANELKKIAMWLGPGVEYWDPSTPNKEGLGGSETAAIEMAKNFVRLGFEVKVYAEAQGVYDGVEYIRHDRHGEVIDCDVFISSRAPWAVAQLNFETPPSLKFLWVHDIHCGPSSKEMEKWLYTYDRVLCLSQWHKNFFCSAYPSLHPDQVIVTRNGIDPMRFSKMLPKENRMVFSSSPNRGLPGLLHNLKYIKEQVPDVHLDVFYGFETWEKIAQRNNATEELKAIAVYKQMLDQAVKEGHVTWHGRKSQVDLANAFLRAKVWGYPTEFHETYCITALEAQAAGCIPVATKLAALAETVKHGVLIEPQQGYGQKFVDTCVKMLKDDAAREAITGEGRMWALTQSWHALAQDWSKMFAEVLEEVNASPIPQWRSA